MDIHRDAAPIIHHGHTAVSVDDDVDAAAGTHQRFVNGIIHNLIHEMVKRFQIGPAHVHTGSAADGFQPLQHLDIFGTVTGWIVVIQRKFLHFLAFGWLLPFFGY